MSTRSTPIDKGHRSTQITQRHNHHTTTTDTTIDIAALTCWRRELCTHALPKRTLFTRKIQTSPKTRFHQKTRKIQISHSLQFPEICPWFLIIHALAIQIFRAFLVSLKNLFSNVFDFTNLQNSRTFSVSPKFPKIPSNKFCHFKIPALFPKNDFYIIHAQGQTLKISFKFAE